jgi:hypothetical protein
VPDEQFANLRDRRPPEPARYRGTVLDAEGPLIAPRPATRRMEREQDLADIAE